MWNNFFTIKNMTWMVGSSSSIFFSQFPCTSQQLLLCRNNIIVVGNSPTPPSPLKTIMVCPLQLVTNYFIEDIIRRLREDQALKIILQVSAVDKWNIFQCEKINFVSSSDQITFFSFYQILAFSWRFPTIFWRFPKIFQKLQKITQDYTLINLSVVLRDKRKFYQKWYM